MDDAYILCRKFGEPANICWRESSVVDRPTGLKTTVLASYLVRRAIVLQESVDRQFVYNLTWIASNKNFTYGALFDARNRSILLRAKDIPADLEIKVGFYVVVATKRYEIESIDLYHEWYNLKCKQVTGIEAQNVISKTLYQEVFLKDEATYDIS